MKSSLTKVMHVAQYSQRQTAWGDALGRASSSRSIAIVAHFPKQRKTQAV